MRRLVRHRWIAAAVAAALVGVPVAAAAVVAGGGDGGDGKAVASKDSRGEDIDRLIARSAGKAQAVEPDAGLPGGVVVEAGATDFPVPERGEKEKEGGREGVSPGAPSDAEIRRELDAVEREQAKVEKIILNSDAPIRRGSGRFVWPVNGSFTSPFGPRWGRLHAGIDVAAPTGTAIRAADTGQVVIAGWQGGYGNYTCIRHNRSVTTCYGHQSKIVVRSGQVVIQGEVIGAVGSTGNSTGPHLHFEVRINGQPVNPMAYL